MPLPYKLGSSGEEITRWGQWFSKKYSSYAAPVDGYYGNAERDATKELQRRLGLPVTGVFDQLTAERSGFASSHTAPPPAHRPIWFYSAPGSGAPWHVGPSFEVGKWAQDVLRINHQPIGYPIGGYLGFLGGDSKLSYLEVIEAQKVELRRLIQSCPDINDPNVEFWFSGYSQSADGMVQAVHELFGDGGEFSRYRNRINGLVLFGNPARQRGSGPALGWGIARDTYPKWLTDKILDVTNTNDFYACVPENDQIRPVFYDIIIQAEMELPFFVHVLRVALPIITEWATLAMPFVAPMLGGFGPLMQMALSLITGMQGLGNNPLLGNLMGQAGSGIDAEVDRKLIELLKPTGVLQNIPGLIGLISALPGLQAHGEYHLPKPEHGGRTGIQVGCDHLAAFRR